jgi:cytochrome c peroxidase
MHKTIARLGMISMGWGLIAGCGNDGSMTTNRADPGQKTPSEQVSPLEEQASAAPIESEQARSGSSYLPVAITEPFAKIQARLEAEKPAVERGQQALLAERYDLGDRPLPEAAMTRGKKVQGGVRIKLQGGMNWHNLQEMTPEEIRQKDLFPAAFRPLPHPKQAEGGQIFPRFHIDEIKRQEGEIRSLTRFDIDMDLPDHLLPEFPPPIFLTSRPDLGDLSQGKLLTTQTFFSLVDGIMTPKQIDGLRLLLTPMPQQQFNMTNDRRTEKPSLGVTCFDCHANGHTNAALHLDPHTRPQAQRRRLDTPSLRGVNIQRLFGSQRNLKTIEDFTEFEQRGAYFDGDIVTAIKKGMRPLERGSEVANMAEFQQLIDFPPAPKLDRFGKLNLAKASAAEKRGQDLFFGKAQCASCHVPPYYTDNMTHDLAVEQFYIPQEVRGQLIKQVGPIKTFPLRGIKDSPPYLHDGRLLTLDDTVAFFDLVFGLKLSEEEKADLVAFMLAL